MNNPNKSDQMDDETCLTKNCHVYPKPIVFCSRCITFEACRWNRQLISSIEVTRMKPYIQFITHCPEKEMGLGVPRDSLRLVLNSSTNDTQVIQPASKKDFTIQMKEYSAETVSKLPELDGIILKSKSPSCGYKNAKIYQDKEKPFVIGKQSGVFGNALARKYDNFPIINEEELRSIWMFESFLIQIYTLADFRTQCSPDSIQSLIKYQTRHKLLLMACNQEKMRKLGNLVANRDSKPIPNVFSEYRRLLLDTLSRVPNYKHHINVLQHALGFFKEDLNSTEKQFILQQIELYRKGVIPLIAINHIFRSWILHYNKEYLEQQSYFYPFPDELMEKAMFHSSKERLFRTGHR